MAGLRRLLGEDTRIYQAVNDLGIIISSQGRHRYEEAEPLFQEALEGAFRTGGETHDAALEAYNKVGWVRVGLGRVEEAEPYYRKSLEGNRKRHGEHHQNTLVAMNNMSAWLRKMGRGDEGLEMHRQAVEGMKRALGLDHPLTLQVIHNHAHALEGAGEKDEADRVHLEAFKASRDLLGEEHQVTAKRAGCYGDFLNKLEQYEEAASLASASEPAARRLWAEKDPVRLGTYLAKLGEARVGLRRYAEAEVALLESHELLIEGLGPDHDRVADSIDRIVEMYEQWEFAEPNRGHEEQAAGWRGKAARTS